MINYHLIQYPSKSNSDKLLHNRLSNDNLSYRNIHPRLKYLYILSIIKTQITRKKEETTTKSFFLISISPKKQNTRFFYPLYANRASLQSTISPNFFSSFPPSRGKQGGGGGRGGWLLRNRGNREGGRRRFVVRRPVSINRAGCQLNRPSGL